MAKTPPTQTPGTNPEPDGVPVDFIPPAFQGKPGVDLLMDACRTFGIDPDPTLPLYDAARHGNADGRFRELLSWAFYPAQPGEPLPDKVVLVTAGGKKLTWFDDMDYPLDPQTELTLRNEFHAWTIDPKTSEQVPLPLPADLTLPRTAVDGRARKGDHVYQKGYLKEGGAKEAERRDQVRRRTRTAKG